MLLAGDIFLHPLDNEFFDEYKRLDQLCSDMYSSRGGLGLYIEDMEKNTFNGRRLVPDWEAAYAKLKHLRWVRNRIAHDPDELNICTEEDIEDVCLFYDSILSRQDPLALLHRAQTAPKQKPQPSKQPAEPDKWRKIYDSPYYSPKPKQNTNTGGCSRLLWAFIIIVVLICFIFNYF